MECLLVCGIAGAFVLGLALGGGACQAKVCELEQQLGILEEANRLLDRKVDSLMEEK